MLLQISTARGRRRLLNQLVLAACCTALTAAFYFAAVLVYPENERAAFRWSLTTAYIATLLLSATLTVGTINLVRRRPNPISTDTRRDIGIWCFVLGIAHVIFGLNVHMRSWKLYFVTESGLPRIDVFGFANYLGVAATVILAILCVTSNDFSLKRLGKARWKQVQRFNYLLAGSVFVHGAAYVYLEQRIKPYIFVIATLGVLVIVVQVIGFRSKRLPRHVSPGAGSFQPTESTATLNGSDAK